MKIFVPIKGESRRLPDKNFRTFGDVPLYKYVLDKFRGMDVYVDTDVPGRIGGVEAVIYTRREALRGNDISVNKLIGHFVHEIVTDNSETIVQMHVTSPFISSETILRAVESLEDGYSGKDSIVSCTSLQARFWRQEVFYGGGDIMMPVNHDPRLLEQTQALKPLLMEDSLFYIFTKAGFEEFDNRIGAQPMFWPTNFPENLDIDTQADWNMAEALLKAGVAR